ncbi:MAG: peptidoglycan-binding domain-containing protein [Paracoccaceae bacterium]
MRQPILRPGSSGPFVRDLQLALNSRLNPSPRLIVSGIFDAPTGRAVRAFQVANWLEEDGIAGTCTLDAVYETEAHAPILHNVRHLTQPTATTCWAAATAMVKGSSVQVIRMTTPPAMLAPDGGLRNESERGARLDVHRAYARLHGLTYHAPQSWSVDGLIGLLLRGPLMTEMLHDPRSYRRGQGSGGHYYVIVGARGSHGPDGRSTTLRIYDPSPVNQGDIFSWGYATLLREMPLGTYGIMSP